VVFVDGYPMTGGGKVQKDNPAEQAASLFPSA
jgi:hypothetical protein